MMLNSPNTALRTVGPLDNNSMLRINKHCLWRMPNVSAFQRMPESLRALFNIVSLTAAKTRRMFEVSVACVKLYERQCPGRGRAR